MRSTIPALFDPSIDNYGYPLTPGDFHSQNLMITLTHVSLPLSIGKDQPETSQLPSRTIPSSLLITLLGRRTIRCVNEIKRTRLPSTRSSSKRSVFANLLTAQNFHVSSPIATVSISFIRWHGPISCTAGSILFCWPTSSARMRIFIRITSLR